MHRWTKKIDIFSKQYIVVPIHEGYVIIALVAPILILVIGFTGTSPSFTVLANCFFPLRKHRVPPHSWAMPQLQSLLGTITEMLWKSKNWSSVRTQVFILDSWGTKRLDVVVSLSNYLKNEAMRKRSVKVTSDLIGKQVTVRVHFFKALKHWVNARRHWQVPRQPNEYDCGIYLLYFVQTLASDPPQFIRSIARVSASQCSLYFSTQHSLYPGWRSGAILAYLRCGWN
jgi:Ulp1 family protease